MPNRRPIVNLLGTSGELPAGDLLLGAGLVKESVDAGQTVTIPSGYQYVVHGFDIVGTLDVAGKLILL